MRIAQSGPAPKPTDPKVMEEGETVFVTESMSAILFEVWVKDVVRMSGQAVDWYIEGERIHVVALGDIARVRDAIRELMPVHDHLFYEEKRRFMNDAQAKRLAPPRPDWWRR